VDISDITAAIEALAGLHAKGFLTDDEFFAKKSELLGRL
ncbi:MAG: SHOCT domain-containing protein, partial [Rhodococcus sp.]